MIFHSLFTFLKKLIVGTFYLHHVSLIIHPSNRADRKRIEMPTNENDDYLRTKITTFEKGSQNLLKHTQLSLHLFHGRSSHLIQRGAGRFAALEVRRLGRLLVLLGRFLVLLGRFLVLLGRFLVLLGLLFGVLEVGLGLFSLEINCIVPSIELHHKKTIKIIFCLFKTFFLSEGSSKVKALPELRS